MGKYIGTIARTRARARMPAWYYVNNNIRRESFTFLFCY